MRLDMDHFNLLKEKWIKVIACSGKVEEVSLAQAIVNAHAYRDLAGETPSQDAALFRMILGLCVTVFYRYDPCGERSDIASKEDALQRWKNVWDMKSFPENMFSNYFKTWSNRFNLLDDIYPFYQVPFIKSGTGKDKVIGAYKLNAEISESDNKHRSFSVRTGEAKGVLTYPEAARWICFHMVFDDGSLREMSAPQGYGRPKGWPGDGEVITADGKNLFERIMLNLVLLRDGAVLWPSQTPSWEQNDRSGEPKLLKVPPNDLASILTLQTRRMKLVHEGGRITGFIMRGGEVFKGTDAFAEQYVLWEHEKGTDHFIPRKNLDGKALWREFGSIFPDNRDRNGHYSGVIEWNALLLNSDDEDEDALIEDGMEILYRTVSVKYKEGSAIKDIFSDSIRLDSSWFHTKNLKWIVMIRNEVGKCEEAAKCIGDFAGNLQRAAGNTGQKEKGVKAAFNEAKIKYYSVVDLPFRKWIDSIDITKDDRDQVQKKWEWTSRALAIKLMREFLDQTGNLAFSGHTVKKKKEGSQKEEDRLYTSPICVNIFYNSINNVYPEVKDGGNTEHQR